MPLVEVRDLVKVFPAGESVFGRARREVRAVDRVSLEIAAGETLGLVGESGSGKSTLGRLILRLIEPTSGSVHFDGRDVLQANGRELRRLRRDMQIIFQDPVGSQIINLLARLQRELGLTYLFISHSMPLVRYISSRIAVMYRGKLVEVGVTDQITTAPRHPYTRSLLAATPEIEQPAS